MLSLAGLVAVTYTFLHQPHWKQSLEMANFFGLLDDIFDAAGPRDHVAKAAIIESERVSTKTEKAKILFFALMIRDPRNTHEGEEIAEIILHTGCGKEIAEIIRTIPKSEWQNVVFGIKCRGFLGNKCQSWLPQKPLYWSI
jgi:hypothetical protein